MVRILRMEEKLRKTLHNRHTRIATSSCIHVLCRYFVFKMNVGFFQTSYNTYASCPIAGKLYIENVITYIIALYLSFKNSMECHC